MRIIGSSTYRKILLILIITLETLLIVYAAFAFSVSSYIAQQEIEKLNQQVVEKLSKNIQYMDDIVNRYTTMVINDNRMNTLLYSKDSEQEQFERIQTLLHLKRMSESYGIIHSTVIYNGVDDTAYSWEELHTADPLVYEIKTKAITVTAPIWRKLPKDSYYNGEETVITYVMYGPYGTDGFVLVNVKTDWLENDLKHEGGENRVLMVLNSDGGIVAHSRNSSYDTMIPVDLLEKLNREKGNFNYKNAEGQTYVATYNNIGNGQWIFLSLSLYEVMFSGLNQLERVIILITLLFGVVGIIMVLFVGKRIYNPLRAIALKAETVFGFKNSGKDEIDYLNSVIESESVLDRISGTVMLKEILLNGENEQYTLEKALSLSEKLASENELMLVYVKAEQIAKLREQFEELECETIVMERGKTLVAVAKYDEKIRQLCRNLREDGEVIVVCESPKLKSGQDICEVFKKLEHNAAYRVIYGNQIYDEMIQKNLENTNAFIYPTDRATQILDALKADAMEKAEEAFAQFLEKASENSLNNFFVALTKLILSLFEDAYYENSIRAGHMAKKIFEADSREEIVNIFKEVFVEIIENNQRKKNNEEEDLAKAKTERIVEAIQMIIDNSYDSSALCVATIADEMKLSSGYIGKLFRQKVGMSVSDYINKIRMDEAARLLSTTDYTIKKVIDLVGYDNESTFYKKFKSHTGMTPKEFRMFNSDSSGFISYTIE